MKKPNNPYSYKTALVLALTVTLLLNLIFLLVFLLKDPKHAPSDVQIAAPFEYVIVHMVNNFIFAFILYLLNFCIFKKNFKSTKRLSLSIALSISLAVILSLVSSKIQHQFFFSFRNEKYFIIGNLFLDFFITIIILFSSHLMYLYVQRQQTMIENQKLLAENMRTRYEVLKNQVDPHFLFNALNTLNSLIKIDADKAQEYVQQLSLVFRYTMQNKETITLEEELKFTRSYCHLMKIRYGESLQFHYAINEKYNKALVVPLSLQTLVENAIKHNVITKKQPLIISLFTTDGNTLIVFNPMQPKKELSTGGQLGLANLRERYQLMWKKNIQITQTDTTFQVEIPLHIPEN